MCISKMFVIIFTVRVYLEELQCLFLKVLFFIYRIRDFALLMKMYKNKRNVMDFTENVQNEFTGLKYIIKFNIALVMYILT